MFVSTRESIARRSVRRKRKNRTRDRHVNNFSTSKSIGIYFETTSTESFKRIREFSKELEKSKIKTRILGFVDAEEIPSDMSLWDNCQIIIPKDLDLFFRPRMEQVEKFIEKDFDILIDLSLEDSTPGYFICSLSLAHFKVGRFRESENDIDLMINIDQDRSVEFLMGQIRTYVAMLNQKNN